jgi:AcrR family transcriptional regulator
MDKADIQRAALYRFAEQGYHATTLRHLANDLGVTPAAFYYHFKNKDELLTSLIEEILTSDLEVLRRIRRENTTDPLDELLYAHVYWMCLGREEALVVEREAKHLAQEFRRRVARMTREYERQFMECIAEEYELSGDDLALATRAVVGLGESVVQWFHAGGALTAHDIAAAFSGYARGILERAEWDATKGMARRRRAASRNGPGSSSYDGTVRVVHERLLARRQTGAARSAAPVRRISSA